MKPETLVRWLPVATIGAVALFGLCVYLGGVGMESGDIVMLGYFAMIGFIFWCISR